ASRRDLGSIVRLSAARIMGCLAVPLTRTVTLCLHKVSHDCPVVSCSSPRVWISQTSRPHSLLAPRSHDQERWPAEPGADASTLHRCRLECSVRPARESSLHCLKPGGLWRVTHFPAFTCTRNNSFSASRGLVG